MQQARLGIQDSVDLHLKPRIFNLLALGMTSILLLPLLLGVSSSALLGWLVAVLILQA
jgi:hypothetical protein